jgi:hypothetical protein
MLISIPREYILEYIINLQSLLTINIISGEIHLELL